MTDQETLALLEGIRANRIYITHKKFTVYTDHLATSYLQSIKSATGRLFRWALQLQHYTFDIIHKPGKTQHIDGLSRIKYKPGPEDPDDELTNDDLAYATITEEEIEEIHDEETALAREELLQEFRVKDEEANGRITQIKFLYEDKVSVDTSKSTQETKLEYDKNNDISSILYALRTNLK